MNDQAFLDRALEWSLYDTGVSVTTDDHILTLITCDRDYNSEDGQLVVMAVQQYLTKKRNFHPWRTSRLRNSGGNTAGRRNRDS